LLERHPVRDQRGEVEGLFDDLRDEAGEVLLGEPVVEVRGRRRLCFES